MLFLIQLTGSLTYYGFVDVYVVLSIFRDFLIFDFLGGIFRQARKKFT